MSRFEPLVAFPKSRIQIGRESKVENVHLQASPGIDLSIEFFNRFNEKHTIDSAT